MTDLKNLSIKELKALQEDISTELIGRVETSRENYQKKINELIREIQEEGFSVCDENEYYIDHVYVEQAAVAAYFL